MHSVCVHLYNLCMNVLPLPVNSGRSSLSGSAVLHKTQRLIHDKSA